MTQYSHFIVSKVLEAHRDDPGWVVVDCTSVLGDREAGRRLYLESHIPGAVHADLEGDMTGPVLPGRTGRHPLPPREDLVRIFSRLGISNDSQVVVYDAANGQMAAARFWWLLKWAGHDAVALLDGGLAAWKKAGLPAERGERERVPSAFVPAFRDRLLATTEEISEGLEGRRHLLLDSRTKERFDGHGETIDPVAGHIPGAISCFYGDTVGQDGLSLGRDALAAHFRKLVPGEGAPEVVFYCGSGVTAAVNVVAYGAAGLGMARLYAGSWSEWIRDPGRPVG